MSLCLCSDRSALDCSGGGLPRVDGACLCECHRAALAERWPLTAPEVTPTLGAHGRARIYELAAIGPMLLDEQRVEGAMLVCHQLRAMLPVDRTRTLATLWATGDAAPFAGAVLRHALLMTRSRLTAGLVRVRA